MRLGWAATEELGKITKSKDVLLETKVKIIHILICPVTMFRYKSWAVSRADKKKVDSFEIRCWRKALQIPWTA